VVNSLDLYVDHRRSPPNSAWSDGVHWFTGLATSASIPSRAGANNREPRGETRAWKAESAEAGSAIKHENETIGSIFRELRGRKHNLWSSSGAASSFHSGPGADDRQPTPPGANPPTRPAGMKMVARASSGVSLDRAHQDPKWTDTRTRPTTGLLGQAVGADQRGLRLLPQQLDDEVGERGRAGGKGVTPLVSWTARRPRCFVREQAPGPKVLGWCLRIRKAGAVAGGRGKPAAVCECPWPTLPEGLGSWGFSTPPHGDLGGAAGRTAMEDGA